MVWIASLFSPLTALSQHKMVNWFKVFITELSDDVKARMQELRSAGATTFQTAPHDKMKKAIMTIADKHSINPLEVRTLFLGQFHSLSSNLSQQKAKSTGPSPTPMDTSADGDQNEAMWEQ